jgi:hypothetical protein
LLLTYQDIRIAIPEPRISREIFKIIFNNLSLIYFNYFQS